MSTRRSGSSDLTGRRRSPALAIVLAAAALTNSACGLRDAADEASPAPEVTSPSTTAAEPSPGDDGPAAGNGSTPVEGTIDGSPGFAVEPARWEACGGGLECATVTVPLDHQDPTGATIDLALIRVPATDLDGSGIVGSILVNPGGPGASGVDMIRSGFRLDDESLDDHHLVGFDPRGIGASSPLRCNEGLPEAPLPDFAPDDEAERAELDRVAEELARRCDELDGPLLPHLSTESVVADLDLLRKAVGDDRLNYLGLSYGTYIGLRYADRHPDRVGRMVLDGVVDPSLSLVGLLTEQADGFDRLLGEVDGACGDTLSCPTGGIIAAYDRVAGRLDDGGPIDGVGPTELGTGTLLALYAESLWPRLASALDEADRGSFAQIRALNDIYAEAADLAAYHAVICTDGPVPRGPEGWDRLEADLETHSSRFGALLANELRACAHWPVRSTSAPAPVAPDDVAPILVLSTTGDAATPVENAVAVAAALPGAGLVTVDDTSHTAYGRNFCVDRIVADYLATGEVPPSVHRC